jgi:transcription antitermination factor NusG
MRVRIARGPLADVEGFLVRGEDERGILVVSIDLLQRSVALRIDCTSIVPA